VPVLQTYAAYTRRLDEINAAALRSPDGPGGILRQSAAIDGKHPLWESPRYQLAMLCRFTQKATDGHWQALVRDADRCAPPRALGRVTAEAGEMVAVPRAGGSLVIAELRPLPGNQDAGDDAPAALCGAARYPLSQGFPSGPLVLQADASGWSRGSLPQGCETFGANRRVEIVFASIAIRGGI
jgi:hypothetical protein